MGHLLTLCRLWDIMIQDSFWEVDISKLPKLTHWLGVNWKHLEETFFEMRWTFLGNRWSGSCHGLNTVKMYLQKSISKETDAYGSSYHGHWWVSICVCGCMWWTFIQTHVSLLLLLHLYYKLYLYLKLDNLIQCLCFVFKFWGKFCYIGMQ